MITEYERHPQPKPPDVYSNATSSDAEDKRNDGPFHTNTSSDDAADDVNNSLEDIGADDENETQPAV